MAASDQTYRKQYMLDVVFAGSSILMLVSIVLMFMQDYYRPWKQEQRAFRDVEAAVAQTTAFEQIPTGEEFDKLTQLIANIEKNRKDDGTDKKIADLKSKMDTLRATKEQNDSKYQGVKEQYDSKLSFVNLAPNKHERDKLSEELKAINEVLKKVQATRDGTDQKMKDYQGNLAAMEKELTDARGELKKLNDRFLTQTAQSINKRWGWGDFLRGLPIVDGFASPTKIHQYTITDVPIDYNLAYVRRFDRCTTCHQGIDRPAYTKDMLASIRHPLPESMRADAANLWTSVQNLQRKKLDADTLKKKNLVFPESPYSEKAAWSKLVLDGLVKGNSASAKELTKYFENKPLEDVKSDWYGFVAEADKAIKDARPELRDKAKRRALINSYFERQWRLLEAQGRLELLAKSTGAVEAKTIPRPEELQLTYVSERVLTDSRIKEFCAHPRQELFVGSSSKHPAEKFGCTSCHQGQGDGTTFNGSFHSPNNSTEEGHWKKDHAFGSDKHTYLWDYPMLPMRFVESSCLKCHHQVTDLYSANNRNEAPKLLRGYNLLRENGCFGCHEIQGRKEGRQVGPDIRLEPTPPLEDLEPLERKRIESDLDTRPGDYRKVGPSLYRLAEKTNPEWTVKWLRGPRTFRPDTKMPHFYELANNLDANLPEAQRQFPEAEMHAITHYLFKSSDTYRKDLEMLHPDPKDPKKVAEYEKNLQVEEQALRELIAQPPPYGMADKIRLETLLGEVWVARHSMWMNETDRKRLSTVLDDKLESGPVTPAMIKAGIAKLRMKVHMRKSPLLVDLVLDAKHKVDPELGRQLFSEKGCLACHSHDGTHKKSGSTPAMISEAQFGPNLSQITDKLGSKAGDTASARIWLRQWIKDPHVHSPRSRMPIIHLSNEEIADVAEWLLQQSAKGTTGKDWDSVKVDEPDFKKYQELATVYLKRLMPADYVKKYLAGEVLEPAFVRDLPWDEQYLSGKANQPEALKYYLGKKTVGRLGCYGCHDVPGFDAGKPIGTGLMDWGKKKSDKLAFEAVAKYIDSHYTFVPSLRDKEGNPLPVPEDGKMLYEQFFRVSVDEHGRQGYLNQKLLEPRSYDYQRDLAWDDRSRMPQYKFARSHKKEKESEKDFEARKVADEAEAREAVMTFVLGLVADPVPLKSINQPTGDRAAEVRGRQIIDKYNCAGCHIIRAGVFDFKLTKEGAKLLDGVYDTATKNPDFYKFPTHYDWAGKNPEAPDRLTAEGLYNFFYFSGSEDKAAAKNQTIKLSHALRYPSGQGGLRDIPAPSLIEVPLGNMISPPPSAFASEEDLRAYLRDRGHLGGDFSALLMKYLMAKDPNKYKKGEADLSSEGLASGPPSLIGQGERTQTGWLTKFLRDPQPIRKMAVLRMPKFNLTENEAEDLVHYFAAVSRIQNVGTQIDYPNAVIPQQADFDSDYWKKKNQEYVKRLKEELPGGGTLYDQRVKQLQPLFEGKLQPRLDAAKARLELAKKAPEATLKERLDAAEKEAKDKKEEFTKDKKDEVTKFFDDYEKKALLTGITLAEANVAGWEREVALLQKPFAKRPSAEVQQKEWEDKYAYVADSFRLATKICMECHQLGNSVPTSGTPGPPLTQANQRLRPEWAKYWIAMPQRFLHYQSIMPINFPNKKLGPDGTSLIDAGVFQEQFTGKSLDQVIAARDLLMVYNRIDDLPLIRYWILLQPELAKQAADEKNKKDAEKKK